MDAAQTVLTPGNALLIGLIVGFYLVIRWLDHGTATPPAPEPPKPKPNRNTITVSIRLPEGVEYPGSRLVPYEDRGQAVEEVLEARKVGSTGIVEAPPIGRGRR